MEDRLEKQIEQILKNMKYKISEEKYRLKNCEKNQGILKKLKKMDIAEIGKAIREGACLEPGSIGDFSVSKTVNLIDFAKAEENQFCAYVKQRQYGYQFDAIITINEIPIAVMEFCMDVERGCLAIEKHIVDEELDEIFKTVQLLVVINEERIQYKPNCQKSTWKNWELAMNEKLGLEKKLETFFQMETFLKWIKDARILLCGKPELVTYYQYWAVQKVMENLKKRKGSKVFLTPGSGRMTAILFLMKRLQSEQKGKKILLVVDRLSKQDFWQMRLRDIFTKGIEVANSRMHLEKLLDESSTKIIVTTIEKMRRYSKGYLEEICVITNLSSDENEEYLEGLVSELYPKAEMIIFTNQNDEKKKFVYQYDIEQAIQEEVLSRVYHATRDYPEKERVDKLKKEILDNTIRFSQKETQSLIVTQKNKVIFYLKELGKQLAIASTSDKDETEPEFWAKIEQENGSLKDYQEESLELFNAGKLKILVVTSERELKDVMTNNVRTIYLDTAVNKEILEQTRILLNHKDAQKGSGFLIDYGQNLSTIEKIKEEIGGECLETDAEKVICEVRATIGSLIEMKREINQSMETIEGMQRVYESNEVEIFVQKVKKLADRLFDIYYYYTQEKITPLLENNEPVMFKERFNEFLEMVDKICVIYAKEVDWEELAKQVYFRILGESFIFTKVQKSDLWRENLLEGSWIKLTRMQKTEAIKNRIKRFVVLEKREKKVLDILEKEYQEQRISDIEYEQKIEQIKEKYKQKMQEEEIPKVLKKNVFDSHLYTKLKDMSYADKMHILKERKFAKMVSEIRNQIEKNVKIGWERNHFLLKKMELEIIQMIYKYIDEEVIDMKEEQLEEFLKHIQKIALDVFSIPVKQEERRLYYIKMQGIYAVGEMREGAFVVLENSTVAKELKCGLAPSYAKKIKQLKKSGVIVQNCFVKDYDLKSPSSASTIILGRNSNGYKEWKDKDGVPLDKLRKRG